MFKSLIGETVSVVVSSRTDNLLEYVGTLTAETDETIELSNVSISSMMLSFQIRKFGSEMNRFRSNLEKVIINKKYVISCSN